jgi:hypothetical protein
MLLHRSQHLKIERLPSGNKILHLTAQDTREWADRPGKAWPYSTLRGKTIRAEFAKNGDLVDVNIDSIDNVDIHEFNAITKDFLNAEH